MVLITGMLMLPHVAAQAATPQEEISELKARIAQLEERLVEQEKKTFEVEKVAHGAKRDISEFVEYTPGSGVSIKPAELVIGAGATFIVQGAANANSDDFPGKPRDVTDASYSM
ncbi:MAG: hypothetical protein PHY34_06510, partial [Patescibacteria group bacterium]|nr:hypothetical protein [Patescibacteria group bacterium]